MPLLLRALLSLFFFTVLFSTRAEAIESECIAEPVFGAEACIYLAGPREAPGVILVHGLGGAAIKDWEGVIKALSPHYRVLTFDLPGFGQSSKANAAYSPENYVKFIDFVASRYGLERFHLVGHSMGGAVSLLYAANFPDKVQRLVVADVAGVLHRLTLTKHMVGGWWDEFTGLPGAAAFASRMAGKLLEELEGIPGFRGFVDTPGHEMNANASPTQIAAVNLVNHSFANVLPNIQTPTLILWGGQDAVAPVRTGYVLRHRLVAAQLRIVPQAGHAIMQDAPVEVAGYLTEFLARAVSELPSIANNTKPVLTTPPPPGSRVGVCDGGKATATFTGSYSRIEITHCEARIDKAWVGELVVKEGRVSVNDSAIISNDQAINALGAEVELTATRVQGRVAIQTSRSRLDIAGSELIATEALVRATRGSTLIFSLTETDGPGERRILHDIIEVSGDRQF